MVDAGQDASRIEAPQEPGTARRDYLHLSRTHSYSLTFALPLLIAYEVLVAAMNRREVLNLRNMADWMVRGLLQPRGVRGASAVTLTLIAAAVVIILRERSRDPVPWDYRVFGVMMLESIALAAAFGVIVSQATSAVLGPLAFSVVPQAGALSIGQRLILALGAGVYEELVFRVAVVTGIAWIVSASAQVVGRTVRQGVALTCAVVGSALVFSLVHYVGAYGEPLEAWSFTYRFIGGLAFSSIFALRGYGIVAWTHALYDVFVILPL